MANSTVQIKNIGDQLSADELNNIVAAVNSKVDRGSQSPIIFSQNVKFDSIFQFAEPSLITGNLIFVPVATNRIAGAVTLIKLVADGTSTVNFFNIKQISSSNYDNRDGILNYLAFFFDGINYYVNIYQELNATEYSETDLVAPVLQSAIIASGNIITLTYSETLDPTSVPSIADYTVSGKTVTGVSIVNNTVLVTVNTNFIYSDVVTLSYVSGANKLKDQAGNIAINVSNYSVTNNIAAPFTPVTWGSLASATNSGDGTIVGTGTASGGVSTTSIDATNPFEFMIDYASLSATEAVVVFLDDDNTADFAWSGALVFVSGIYQYAGAYNAAPNGGTPINLSYTPSAFPIKIKMTKSGNDIVYTKSENGGASYTPLYTHVGVLAGKTTLYLKSLFAVSAGSIKVTKTA